MKYIFFVLIFVFQSAFLFCVDYILQEPVFKSNRACSMADAVFSNPIGIDSLLYNPAGLSEKFYSKNEKASINLALDIFVKNSAIDEVQKSDFLQNAKNQISQNGIGAKLPILISFIPQKNHVINWAVGFCGGTYLFANGEPFPLGTQGYLHHSFYFPIALSCKFIDYDSISANFGMCFNPKFKTYKIFNAYSKEKATFSVPVDLGFILNVKNVFYNNSDVSFCFVTKNLFTEDIFVNIGVASIFPFKIFKIDCAAIISAELHQINYLYMENNVYKSLRIGGELGFADFVFLRAGLKSGYFSFGIEFKILSCMLGFSWQTSENGTYIGDNPLSVLKFSFTIK